VGLAQAALDTAVAYAGERRAFGQTIDSFQGVAFLLADAAARIAAARQLYLYAARRKDAGKPFSAEAAMAKLTATDMAMAVTTDMVQVLGGAGYVQDHPVERYMREAKVLQIVEGTNQIQRMVIVRSLGGKGKRR
jgi:alkylation response protein AidB-like acyl-CoA dehydrogenase